jgi:hypothetical protein
LKLLRSQHILANTARIRVLATTFAIASRVAPCGQALVAINASG